MYELLKLVRLKPEYLAVSYGLPTCYVIPKQSYQQLNIFLQHKPHSLSAIHIMMSRKSSWLYQKQMLIIKKFLYLNHHG